MSHESTEERADAVGARLEFKVALKRRVLAGKPKPTAAPPSPPPKEVPRVVRLLALAHRWHRLIDEGRVRDQADIARRMGLSRARVTQIVELRWLPPTVQEEILLADDGTTGQLRLAERQLRRLARRKVWAAQLRA